MCLEREGEWPSSCSLLGTTEESSLTSSGQGTVEENFQLPQIVTYVNTYT